MLSTFASPAEANAKLSSVRSPLRGLVRTGPPVPGCATSVIVSSGRVGARFSLLRACVAFAGVCAANKRSLLLCANAAVSPPFGQRDEPQRLARRASSSGLFCPGDTTRRWNVPLFLEKMSSRRRTLGSSCSRLPDGKRIS